MKIVMFTSNSCKSCKLLKQKLDGYDIETVNVANGMSAYSNIPIGTLPTTIALKNGEIERMWVGYSGGILREIKEICKKI